MGLFNGLKTQLFNLVMTVIMILSIYSPGADLPTAEAVHSALDGLQVAIAVVWGVGVAIFRAISTVPGPLGDWFRSRFWGGQ